MDNEDTDRLKGKTKKDNLRKKKKKTKEEDSDDEMDSDEEERLEEEEKKKKKEEQEKKEKEERQNKTIYNDRFEIQPNRLLGKGSFGEIYVALDLSNRQYCALKLENSKNKNAQLKNERTVIELLKACEGFPKLIDFGTQNDSNYMVMDLLGPNLSDLFDFCGQKFTLQTVVILAIQMISRVQDLHSRNYIHRDIKPENFLVGTGKNSNTIFIIDFGLSKKYKDSKMDHMPYKEGKVLTGTARYASINNHLGIEQSRRDDLEAIGYVLIYFLKKKLPWQGCQGSTKQEKYNKILEKKLTISVEILCKDFPIEFNIYMNYCKNLKYNERPDYNFLKILFIDLLYHHYNEKFVFDWALPNPGEEANNKKTNEVLNKNKKKSSNPDIENRYDIDNDAVNASGYDQGNPALIEFKNTPKSPDSKKNFNQINNTDRSKKEVNINTDRTKKEVNSDRIKLDQNQGTERSYLTVKTKGDEDDLDKTEVHEGNDVDANELVNYVKDLHLNPKRDSEKTQQIENNKNNNVLIEIKNNQPEIKKSFISGKIFDKLSSFNGENNLV